MLILHCRYILRGNGRGMHQSPFLSALAVHLNAFTICATYLCYGFLDVDAPDTMLANIRNGDYCLLSYSKNYWLRHFETCCKLGPDVSSARNMVTLLSRVVQLRRNLPLRGIPALGPARQSQEANSASKSMLHLRAMKVTYYRLWETSRELSRRPCQSSR